MEIGRGKPVTQLPAEGAPGETPPKRAAGRPRGARTRQDAPSKSTRSLETQIGGLLTTFNLAFYVIPGLRSDALDAVEIRALAKGIDQQAKQSATFRRYLEAALGAGSGGALIGVVAMIGARRAARHGMLPPEVDGVMGAMLSGSLTNTPPVVPSPSEDTVGAAAAAAAATPS